MIKEIKTLSIINWKVFFMFEDDRVLREDVKIVLRDQDVR